jgi:hypothetical protein
MWTKSLGFISHLDPQREPVFHNPKYGIVLDPKDETVLNAAKYTVTVNFDDSIYIAPGNPLPVIKTLKEIQAGVTDTLAAFNPIPT